MKILFTICARAGSKGCKNKNIRDFLDQPLVYYTLSVIDLFIKHHTMQVSAVDLAVNTDSKELIEIIDKTSIKYVYIERKVELALDNSSKVDVIKDTLLACENILDKQYDYVLDLDLTSPLRTLDNLYELIKVISENQSLDVVFSVTNARRNPYFNMVKKEGEYYERFETSKIVARQQAPIVYDMNASMYIYRVGFLKQEKSLGVFDGKVSVIHMLDTGVLDIDNEEDFELMQVIAPYFYGKYIDYAKVKDNIEKLEIDYFT